MTDKTIKSVRRMFEILELYNQERRPLPAKEIAKRLNYPLMSTHALLKSMHELGYAEFDRPTWSYIPSANLISVLQWLRDYLDPGQEVLDFVDAVNLESLETVNLSRRVATKVRIIHGLEAQHPVGVSVKVGTLMPVTQSLTGIAALARMGDDELDEFLSDFEKIDPEQEKTLDRKLVDRLLSELSEHGTVAASDLFIKGIGAVCMPVISRKSGEVLVVGVVGPSDRITQEQDKHRKTLQRLAKKFKIRTLSKQSTSAN